MSGDRLGVGVHVKIKRPGYGNGVVTWIDRQLGYAIVSADGIGGRMDVPLDAIEAVTSPGDRLAHAARVLAELDGYGGEIEQDWDGSPFVVDDLARFLLVERSVHGDGNYTSTHDSVDAAMRYVSDAEYPDDYEVVAVWDLDSGGRVPGRAVRVTRWEVEA